MSIDAKGFVHPSVVRIVPVPPAAPGAVASPKAAKGKGKGKPAPAAKGGKAAAPRAAAPVADIVDTRFACDDADAKVPENLDMARRSIAQAEREADSMRSPDVIADMRVIGGPPAGQNDATVAGNCWICGRFRPVRWSGSPPPPPHPHPRPHTHTPASTFP